LARTPIYIVGAAETALGEVRDQSELSMVALAAREALAEAGMTVRDVDGLFVNLLIDEDTVQVGEYLGIYPRFSDCGDFGGASFEIYLHHAMLALASGACDVALIAYASRQRTRRSRAMALPGDWSSLTAQFEVNAGLPAPLGHYALVAARHMHEFGTTREQLAEVAVAARKWAQLNPKAWSRSPLTVEDVLQSKPICEPLHRLDCCLVTDGGGAVVVTTAERARNAAKKPVRILGAGEAQTHWRISELADLSISATAKAGRDAFARAGITPADIDLLEPYDSFTITVLRALEDLGFCGPGEGGSFVQGGRLAPGGALPAMTSGGGLSYNHPGMLGLLLIIEAVRQLRWEAGDRQVPGAKIGVAHGVGGFFSTAGTVVLARD
jgi:acetyl-CoA acetyltransferase